MTSITVLPPFVWPLAALMGSLLAFAEVTETPRMYRAVWALAGITAFLIGFSIV